ncbi:hypothetical protein [Elizabethkingia meningoseptica]|uniref:hypothetical protein n=1 Tax=Elizabethkingia meningoseptica TaxID=238 RepID=UPI0015926E36|nr:hypothetical protein [Elizabethkingia meningoseptica]
MKQLLKKDLKKNNGGGPALGGEACVYYDPYLNKTVQGIIDSNGVCQCVECEY